MKEAWTLVENTPKENQRKKINVVLSFLFYTVLVEVSGLSLFISCFRVFMEYSIGEAVDSYNTKKVRYLNMQS